MLQDEWCDAAAGGEKSWRCVVSMMLHPCVEDVLRVAYDSRVVDVYSLQSCICVQFCRVVYAFSL